MKSGSLVTLVVVFALSLNCCSAPTPTLTPPTLSPSTAPSPILPYALYVVSDNETHRTS